MRSDESQASVPNKVAEPAVPGIFTSSSSRLSPAPKWASAQWLALLGLSVAELLALAVRQSRVHSAADYSAAAAIVREHYQSNDAIVVAPDWADPLLRLTLGDRISAKVAGRTDLAPFERLWVLSLRGERAPEAPSRAPDFQVVERGISVERYDFAPSPVVLDLVDALPTASASIRVDDALVPCTFDVRAPGAERGGIGFGPAAPRQRFVCSSQAAGTSVVGVTIIEDMALRPRRCVLQPPRPSEPVSLTYKDVYLGSELVLYAGLYYEDERNEVGAPVTLRVLVNGRERAKLVHLDGDGMKRYQLDMRAATDEPGQTNAPTRGDLRLEVSASDAIRRSFCWAGSIREARRREAP